ncbi:MAG: Crp/Fnr family transcriptional regulator [Acidobacteria bacterium]|nr:Crp/Fnr family transcriptional regulator [Acidobacteriota bacterium]MBI3424942.1 Crp/Fnr family transcriptional regulator [Acidobacteriota bacterium]
MAGIHLKPERADANLPNCLSQFALWRDLAAADLRQVSERLHSKIFPASTPLMSAEQPGEVVYFIASGTVKVHVEQPDGRDVLIAILGPGEIVGELSVLDCALRSASVLTLEASQLLWADAATFKRWLRTMPPLAHNLAAILAARLRQANEQIQTLAALDTEGRVAHQLVAFAEKYGQPRPDNAIYIPIRLTQSDIAALVGATREHTNKILVSYKERGYLSTNQQYHFTLHNPRALAQRC